MLYFELQSVHCQIENLLFPGRVIDLLSLRGAEALPTLLCR